MSKDPKGIHLPFTHGDGDNNPFENDDGQSEHNEANEIKHWVRLVVCELRRGEGSRQDKGPCFSSEIDTSCVF